MSDCKLGRIYSQVMNNVKYELSVYDWVETHINLQGGELAFTPRLGFWL